MKQRQAGIATLITLIALVIMLIAAVALIRSTSSSQVAAGNLAFRRDMTNRVELAVNQVNTLFTTGGSLAVPAARENSIATENYSAAQLDTDPKSGIPLVLTASDTTFQANAGTHADLTDASSGTTIRYVIDRLCASNGVATRNTCAVGTLNQDTGGSAGYTKAGGTFVPVYRISIRITGPKNTVAFYQTIFRE